MDFFNNNILPADAAALTTIDGFGTFTFDVTSLVNDWISGSNTFHFIALTGNNDPGTTDFLHGFLNNSENPGATTLTVVPEPTTLSFLGLSAIGVLAWRRKR